MYPSYFIAQKCTRPWCSPESALKDNLDILEANGFGFELRRRVEDGCSVAMLVSAPVLHSWQFDQNDCKPSRHPRSALGELKTLSSIQSFFKNYPCQNCPHGRPTLRHLADLHTILK
ncbi:hypothetical protein OESDEN_24939 [Oesophagostomum dentatum]|uniref:Uncharacterized protein n=1 Tax=Oesophagostomum dentatum TaxID=61180 RepID=A0A0B1RWL1_OESDE|nr:hypothetical protein OESDEN_24939 [Oesophagostomum dentatum]